MAEPGTGGHIPPADLAVHALDGPRTPWSPEGIRHLRLCPPCRDTLAAFQRAVAAGRGTHPHEELMAPPSRVWDAIRTEMRSGREERPPHPADRFPCSTAPPRRRVPHSAAARPRGPAPDVPRRLGWLRRQRWLRHFGRPRWQLWLRRLGRPRWQSWLHRLGCLRRLPSAVGRLAHRLRGPAT